jgi:putative phosphoesterase
MKILVIADIHGNFRALESALETMKKEKTDLVICPGDFTDIFSTPSEFSQLDIANLVIQKLLVLNKQILCVPGNQDPYETLELLGEYKINLHNKAKKINGIKFIGWGGARTPFNTIFEPSEEETRDALETLGRNAKDFVLVVHNPPKETKLDLTSSGKHVGSPTIRDFILKKQPILAISAHIHEARGIDKLDKTTLFYPGPIFDGYYGIVEIKGKKVKCEIKKAEI